MPDTFLLLNNGFVTDSGAGGYLEAMAMYERAIDAFPGSIISIVLISENGTRIENYLRSWPDGIKP